MRKLTPEEIRRRNRAVMLRLVPVRIVLAGGTFVMSLRKKGLCGAMKEARELWKLKISR
jgi:hypothetical protein